MTAATAAKPAPPPLAAGATKDQALAYLAKTFGAFKYHNAAKTPYEGKDAAQIYALIAKQHPDAKPHDIAVAVADLLVSAAFAETVGGVVTGTGTATAEIAQGTVGGLDQFASASPFGQVAGFLSALSSRNTWIRVAKVIIGGALLLIGLAHMTGAGNAVAVAARKVPVPL